jgi:poly(3-hydroxybutyrate) depolymerase
MFYQFYEWNHAFLSPARAVNDVVRLYYKNPLNPLSHTEFGRQIVAAGDVFERLTRRYGKPEFGLDTTEVDGTTVAVEERIVWERPFCRLVHFHRQRAPGAPRQPKLVIVAPMSGHYATLLRGTVQALLPHHEVYITDWVDARMVPLALGRFDLDDYIDYVIAILEHLEGEAHVVAVCQPAVPVFAATAILEARQSSFLPRSITLMGGPIDTRESPTEVNLYAAKHDLDWFRRNVILTVPYPYPGVMRRVYPGFLQLSGFMTMNLDRHLSAHYDYFDHLVKGDGDSADKHRDFYDEYLSVMDLTAEFYLQTVDTVFLRQALPKGEMRHRDRLVDPAAITRTPILTIEGEKDDISGIGQTRAAHKLTPNLPDEKHSHYEQKEVGHYGVFNGSRFRREIAPRITDFVSRWDGESGEANRAARALPTFGSDAVGAFEALAAAGTSLTTAGDALAAGVRTAEDAANTAAGEAAEAIAADAADTLADATARTAELIDEVESGTRVYPAASAPEDTKVDDTTRETVEVEAETVIGAVAAPADNVDADPDEAAPAAAANGGGAADALDELNGGAPAGSSDADEPARPEVSPEDSDAPAEDTDALAVIHRAKAAVEHTAD